MLFYGRWTGGRSARQATSRSDGQPRTRARSLKYLAKSAGGPASGVIRQGSGPLNRVTVEHLEELEKENIWRILGFSEDLSRHIRPDPRNSPVALIAFIHLCQAAEKGKPNTDKTLHAEFKKLKLTTCARTDNFSRNVIGPLLDLGVVTWICKKLHPHEKNLEQFRLGNKN